MIPHRSDSLYSFGRSLHLKKSVGFPYRGPSLNSFSGTVMGVLDGRRGTRYGRRTYSSRPRDRVLKKKKHRTNVDGDETATLEMATKPIAEPKALRKNLLKQLFFCLNKSWNRWTTCAQVSGARRCYALEATFACFHQTGAVWFFRNDR